MKNLKDIIIERLHLNKNTKLNNNEDVLVLDNINDMFDFKLFLHCFSSLYEEYKTKNLMVYTAGYNAQRYYDLFDNNILNIDTSNDKKILEIYTSSTHFDKFIMSNDAPKKLIEELKQYNNGSKFYFQDICMTNKYLYVWYSLNDDTICIFSSNNTYENLLKNKYFN